MQNYFPFTSNGDYKGSYSQYNNSLISPIGNICNPSDVLKLNTGSDVWSQIIDTISFNPININISSVSENDWTLLLKYKWFDSYLKHITIFDKITTIEYDLLFTLFETENVFETISAPSIAYVTKNDGINGLLLDSLLTNEVSIGLNVYKFELVKEYALSLPNNTNLKNVVIEFHKKDTVYISNVCKVDYQSQEEVVWCFDGIEYPLYDITNIGLVPSLINGGGNVFGEVKLGGDNIQAHYIVKKNIDIDDPTFGLCSGDSAPFCIGDNIVIVDTTCWTETTINGWTWVGDFSLFDYTWYIADITNPILYYKNTPINDLLFPLRVIMYDKFSDFN